MFAYAVEKVFHVMYRTCQSINAHAYIDYGHLCIIVHATLAIAYSTTDSEWLHTMDRCQQQSVGSPGDVLQLANGNYIVLECVCVILQAPAHYLNKTLNLMLPSCAQSWSTCFVLWMSLGLWVHWAHQRTQCCNINLMCMGSCGCLAMQQVHIVWTTYGACMQMVSSHCTVTRVLKQISLEILFLRAISGDRQLSVNYGKICPYSTCPSMCSRHLGVLCLGIGITLPTCPCMSMFERTIIRTWKWL